MSAAVTASARTPFVAGLRARKGTLDLSRGGDGTITVRVEIPEVWDTVRIIASPNEPVASIKRAALDALCPSGDLVDEFVTKLRGWEVLDESCSLTEAGAINGSIFLITHRRRRAVR